MDNCWDTKPIKNQKKETKVFKAAIVLNQWPKIEFKFKFFVSIAENIKKHKININKKKTKSSLKWEICTILIEFYFYQRKRELLQRYL